jgi:hypothetical protein
LQCLIALEFTHGLCHVGDGNSAICHPPVFDGNAERRRHAFWAILDRPDADPRGADGVDHVVDQHSADIRQPLRSIVTRIDNLRVVREIRHRNFLGHQPNQVSTAEMAWAAKRAL